MIDLQAAFQRCSFIYVLLKCTPNPGGVPVKNYIFCNITGCRHAKINFFTDIFRRNASVTASVHYGL